MYMYYYPKKILKMYFNRRKKILNQLFVIIFPFDLQKTEITFGVETQGKICAKSYKVNTAKCVKKLIYFIPG